MGWKVDVEFKTSSVHGTGVFARRAIKAGTRVWQFDSSMQVCDSKTLPGLPPHEITYALHAGYLHEPSGKFLYYTDGMQWLNHGSGSIANVGLNYWPSRLRDDHLVALRDIAAGEELREDYTFCLEGGLGPDHWMRPLYLQYCPSHLEFLLGLERQKVAA